VTSAAERDPAMLVRLSGVSKDYPKVATGGDRLRTLLALLLRRRDRPHFRALEGIDLEVKRGESVGIIGENGAGKSTLLKVVAGVVRPSSGTIQVNGRVGALLELGSGFHPDYTGRENIYLSGALMGLSRGETQAKVESIIAFADIGAHIDEPIKHYSSGMVVRLGFAVATTLEPELLITDEVLAVGDESFKKKCIAWLERFLAGGGTLLLCSHSMFHIQTLCRTALWIDHGKVRMRGNAFDVTREYLTYHEEKSVTAPAPAPVAAGPMPKIVEIWTEDEGGAPATVFRHGASMVLQGIAYEPDDRAPVILVGLTRLDESAIYGVHSNETGYRPARIEARKFAFAVRFDALALLPGKYRLRAHTLDAEGLRVFDTVEVQIVITGESRDYGVVQLPHRWLDGRGVARVTDDVTTP
jgi:ABC-type polysaccharide/polyol phosphate transport system ATPase subunit